MEDGAAFFFSFFFLCASSAQESKVDPSMLPLSLSPSCAGAAVRLENTSRTEGLTLLFVSEQLQCVCVCVCVTLDGLFFCALNNLDSPPHR